MGKRASNPDPAAKKKTKKSAEQQEGEALVPALPAATLAGSVGASSQAVTINGKMWAQHLENVRLFKEEAVSEDLVQMRPSEHSFGQPFNATAALESLKRDGKHMCLINLMWLDQTWTATPQIPINQGAVNQIKDHWFQKPAGLEQQQVTVGILQQELDSKTFPAFGTWKRLSAEESVLAWFSAAAAEACKVQAGAAGDLLQEWLSHCLACPVLIRVVSDLNEMEWVSQQLREDMTQMSFLQRTPTQRIFDVMQKREAMGVSYTPDALIELYSQKIHLSAKSEKITKGPFLNPIASKTRQCILKQSHFLSFWHYCQ